MMKITDMNFDELCLLVDSEKFYQIINDKEQVELYVNLLHKEYCKENKLKYRPISFTSSISSRTYGYYDYLSDRIFLNEKFLDIYEECKEKGNSYYPFALLTTVIHESRHKWQHLNIKRMFLNDTSYREKLALYDIAKKRYEVTNIEKLKIRNNTKNYTTRELIKIAKTGFLALEFELEYSNSPSELDAEEEAIKALKKIYETTLSENSLSVLLSYVDKKRNSNGLWFLSHEYYEDKENPYNKKAFKVIKEVYMDFLNKSLEMHKQKKYGYHEEEYVLELFPNMSEIISNMEKIGIDVSYEIDDNKEFKKLFHSKPKTLPLIR